MVRETRSRARKPSPPPSSAATPDPAPLFSARTSNGTATPTTADGGEDAPPKRATRGRKRAVSEDLDGEEDIKPVTKRKRVFVELPARPSRANSAVTLASNKKKGKAPERSDVEMIPDSEEEDEVVEAPSTRSKGKGKAKAAPVTPSVSAKSKGKRKAVTPPSDEEELDYDENEALAESDVSGSEFEASDAGSTEEAPSDDDEPAAAKSRKSPRKARPAAVLDADDVEAAMLQAAVRASLGEDAEAGDGAAGPSYDPSIENLASESEALSSDLSEADDDDEDDAPTKKTTKGKKALAALAKSHSYAEGGNVMTLTKLKKKQREERKTKKSARSMIRAEEQELVKKLGRRLIQSEKNTIRLLREHPELKGVWDELETGVKPTTPQKAEQPKNLKVTLLPFQQESLFWMRAQEASVWKGGLLADEMGMGKTIQIISLLVSDGRKPNLVVAPTVAVMQWRNEIETHTSGMKVIVWHGASRASDAKALEDCDVVLTTYAVLESSFRKQHSGFKRKGQIIKEKSLPHSIKWNRVILDEAHNIKERSTNTAKATFELQSRVKWCLSGTPLQNRVGELYSLIRFLGADPFAYYYCKQCSCKSLHWRFSNKRNCDTCGCTPMQHTCFWNNEILSPIQKCGMVGAGITSFKKLRILLDRLMLRRTKVERADDLDLPPRTVIVRKDYFSPEEKELYLSLFSDAKRAFSTYVDSGTVLNNYSNIFSLLTRMRQMACHPDLVLRSKNNKGKFLVDDDSEAIVCRLCNDIAEDAIKARCNHVFDRECIKQYLNTAVEQNPACPVCHLPLTIDLEAPALEIEANSNARQGMLGRLNLDTWRSSTKIEALVEELSNLRTQDATTKSIVFSQFVNFLDLIAFRLQRAGFVICRLEGNMSPQARDLTIKHFMNNVHVTVFLVSLKAGGVALNLTEANRVYLMDSWWNPAVEYQAMDRIHRLGQHRPVQAIKLVVEDSIESRIVQLQEKKSAMVDATLSTDDSAMGRLTPEDLGFLFRL